MGFFAQTRSRTLANGFRSFVLPMPGATVQLYLGVQSGSVHEGEHLGCGLSHFLEHMLFEGTEGIRGDVSASIDALGGSMNAYTTLDHTAYYLTVSTKHLEKSLKTLLAMVRRPSLPEARLAKEREVILRETELSEDPSQRVVEQLAKMLYPDHPLGVPVIGYKSMIGEVTREMLGEYHRRRYTPGRCFLVAVGGIQSEQLFDLVEKFAGDWPVSHPAELFIAPAAPVCVPRREEFYFNDPLSRIILGVQSPASDASEQVISDAATAMLAQNSGARLVRKLERETELAVSVRGSSWTSRYGGFMSMGAATSPARMPKLESELMRELERTLKTGFSRAELTAEKQMTWADRLRERRHLSDVVAGIAMGVIACGAPEFADRLLDKVRDLELDELNDAARRLLAGERRGLVIQHGKKSAPAKKSAAKLSHPGFEPCLDQLPGGLRTVTLCDRSVPMIDFKILLPAGAVFERCATAGCSELLGEMLGGATRSWDEEKLLSKLDSLGVDTKLSNGLNSFSVKFSCPRRNFKRLLPLISEILGAPVFEPRTFAREQSNYLDNLRAALKNPRHAAKRRVSELFFGDHPYSWGTRGLPESVSALTLEEFTKFYRSRWIRNRVIMGWAGDCTPAESAEWSRTIADALPWSDGHDCNLPAPPVPPSEPLSEHLFNDRERCVLYYAVPSLAVDFSREEHCLDILFDAENSLAGPLYQAVRGHEALAYNAGFTSVGGMHPGWMGFSIITAQKNLARAGELVRAEALRLGSEGLCAKHFQSARESAAFRAARNLESVTAELELLMLGMHYGRPVSHLLDYENRLRAVTRAEFNSTIAKFFNHPPVVVTTGRKGGKNE